LREAAAARFRAGRIRPVYIGQRWRPVDL